MENIGAVVVLHAITFSFPQASVRHREEMSSSSMQRGGSNSSSSQQQQQQQQRRKVPPSPGSKSSGGTSSSTSSSSSSSNKNNTNNNNNSRSRGKGKGQAQGKSKPRNRGKSGASSGGNKSRSSNNSSSNSHSNSNKRSGGRGNSNNNNNKSRRRKKQSSNASKRGGNKGIRQEVSTATKVIIRHLPSTLREEQVLEWLSEYNASAPKTKLAAKPVAPLSVEEQDAALLRELEGPSATNAAASSSASKAWAGPKEKAEEAASLLYFVAGKTKKSGVEVHSRAYVICPDLATARDFIAKTHRREFAPLPPVEEEADPAGAGAGAGEDTIRVVAGSEANNLDDDAAAAAVPCECRLAPFPVVVLASHDPKYEDTIQHDINFKNFLEMLDIAQNKKCVCCCVLCSLAFAFVWSLLNVSVLLVTDHRLLKSCWMRLQRQQLERWKNLRCAMFQQCFDASPHSNLGCCEPKQERGT